MARFTLGGAVDNQLVYAFTSSQDADRFLNRLKRGAVTNARAKRQAGGLCIAVQYPIPADATFDNTCQQLDDLAASLGGHEQAP